MRGKVVPALEGVQITVIAERDSLAAGLKSGDIAMTSVTGSDGTYVAGPLHDDTSYVTQAALVCCSSHCSFLVVGFFLQKLESSSTRMNRIDHFSLNRLTIFRLTFIRGRNVQECKFFVLLVEGPLVSPRAILHGLFPFCRLVFTLDHLGTTRSPVKSLVNLS